MVYSWSHRFWCVFIVLTGVIACRSQHSFENDTGLAAVSSKMLPARIEGLSHFTKTKLFAALCNAAYCGNDSNCDVYDRFEQDARTLGVGFALKEWKMEFISARDGEKDIEGYVFFRPDDSDVMITFRGSESISNGTFQDWLTTNARVAPNYYSGKYFRGNVHQGFLNGMYGIWHPNDTGLLKVLTEHNLWGKRFWVTGHSMGGAVGTLVSMRLTDEEQEIAGVYTFGSPKIAQSDFQASYNSRLHEMTYHFANQNDPIPRLEMNLVAVGKTFLFDGQNLRQVDKNGVPSWGLFNFLGDIQAHWLDYNIPQGYLRSVQAYR